MNGDGVAPIAPVDAATVADWDHEADVVVVGLGCAGAAAAIEAAEAGADVLVLERTAAGGGTSAMAGGIIYLGGGTRVQRACGYDDTPEQMEAFLLEACGPGRDAEKIHVYAHDSVAHFEWFVAHGVPFKDEFDEQHDREPRTDAGLLYTGGEDAAPFSAITPPVPRGHKPQFPDAAGGFLMDRMLAAVSATATRVLTGARTDALVVDRDGAVVGVAATFDGAVRHVRARRGVVLAAGGFVYNPAMVAAYCPDAARCAYLIGTDNDDGSGIRMGQGAGGAVRLLDVLECALPIMPPRSLARGVLVDGEGCRFLNEDTYTGRIGQHALRDHDGQAFWIVDQAIDEVNAVGMRVTFAAETPEELAVELGVPPEALAATLARYNADAAAGVDTAFGKHADFLQPLVGPLGAIDLRVDHALYAPFTLGGLHTTVDAQVRAVDGGIVPGLYAAGRTAAGVAGHGYASGLSLGDGTYFGRRAGRHAAGATWP